MSLGFLDMGNDFFKVTLDIPRSFSLRKDCNNLVQNMTGSVILVGWEGNFLYYIDTDIDGGDVNHDCSAI